MLQRIKKSLNDYSLFSSGVRLFNFNQVALQFTTPVFNCFQISFTSTLIQESFYTFLNYWSRHLVSRSVYRGGIQGFRKSRNTTARAELCFMSYIN